VTTTEMMKGGQVRIVSPGHEEVSGRLAETFLERINAPRNVRERVIPLVINHMAHFSKVTDRGVRRLAKRLEPENIHGLLTVMTADAHGRPPRPRGVPENVVAIANKAEELAVKLKAPEAILQGRHLVEAGFRPGPELGEVLRAGYQAQLAGAFFDLPGAVSWLITTPAVKLSAEVADRLKNRLALRP